MNKSELILLLDGCIKTITKKHHKGFDYCTVFLDEIIDTLCRKITDNFKKNAKNAFYLHFFVRLFLCYIWLLNAITWLSVTHAS